MTVRNYAMLSNGTGAVAAGTVGLFDRNTAQANSRDYPIQMCLAGPTSARPKAGDFDFSLGVQAGIHFLDTSLGFIVISDGQGSWRNPASGAAV